MPSPYGTGCRLVAAHRFFIEEPFAGGSIPLRANEARHATALRLRVGEHIELVDARGAASVVELTSVAREGLGGRVAATLVRPWIPRVSLAMGLGKGAKADLVVEKAVELGVERVIPIVTARGVARPDTAGRTRLTERLRRVASAAAAQSHRFEIPHVDEPIPMAGLAARLRSFDAAVVLWEEASGVGMGEALATVPARASVCVVVGPEGGLDASEVDTLVDAGARVATLGPTILRTETAAIVAVALASFVLAGADA